MREQLLHIVGACRGRHAHMPGVHARAFAAGMKVDYGRLESWGRALERHLDLARVLEAQSAAGTKLRLTFAKERRWTPHLGVIRPGTFSNLPAGALFAVPESVEGVFVANASIGEFFGAREGLLLDKPVTLFIEGGRVVKVESPHVPQVAVEISSILRVGPNADRIAVAAVGVNVGLEAATGLAAVDQNLPGLHLVVGDAAGRLQNAPWTARTSFAACSAGTRVTIDGGLAIDEGKLVNVA
jgi:leucyl aminopeptidase (aminopeptidase T)